MYIPKRVDLWLEKMTSAAFWSKSMMVLMELVSTKVLKRSKSMVPEKELTFSSKFLNNVTVDAFISDLKLESKEWANMISS